MAQARARAERYNIRLGPLEDMYAVQSALSQLAEALAADMIDPRRAQALLSVLRLAALNLRHSEKWQTSLYHSGQPVEVDVAKRYGLPRDLDIDTPPEVAFPPPVGGPQLPAVGNCGDPVRSPVSPDVGDSENDFDFRPDAPISPEFLELRAISNTQGPEAAAVRLRQLERNRARRELRTNRKRYADIALRLNLKRAAERLVERRLAEAGVAPPPLDFDTAVAENMKKTAASDREIDACLAGQEVQIA
jgi:hypothetical protein